MKFNLILLHYKPRSGTAGEKKKKAFTQEVTNYKTEMKIVS